MSLQPRDSDSSNADDTVGNKTEGLFARVREGLDRLKKQAEEEMTSGCGPSQAATNNKNLMAAKSSSSANTSTTATTAAKRNSPSSNHDDPRLDRLFYYPRRKATPEEVQAFVDFTNKWIPSAKQRCTESKDDDEEEKKEEEEEESKGDDATSS